MVRTLSRLFNIREGEWSRLSILSLTMFLFILGNTWAQIIIPVAFLVQIGVDKLPYMFIGDALLTILALAVYSAFVDRISNERLMMGITALGVVGVIIGLGILQADYENIAYPFFYLLYRATTEVISTHMGVYVGGFYDTRVAKRIWPVLGSVLRIAVLIGGVTVPLMNDRVSPEGIITLWGATMGLMAFLTFAMPYMLKEAAPPAVVPASVAQEKTSYVQNIKEGYRYILDSNYLRWLALLAFLMMILFTISGFQAYKIFDETLGTTEDITDFTGTIIVAGSLLILPVQLFLFSRLVGRIGVGNTNLIFPFTTLIASFLLIAYEKQWAAGLAYFNIAILNVTFRAPSDEMLFNAVPLRIKGRARAFISGLVIPLGTLTAGILTLPVIPTDRVAQYSAAILGGASIAYVLGALIARNKYSQALITMLEQENFSFLLSSSQTNIVADAATLKYLEDRLNESKTEDFTLFMANVLIDLGGDDAVPILERVARSGSEYLRVGILDILNAANVRSNSVRDLYLEFLHDRDADVRRAAITGLEQWGGGSSPQFLQAAVDLLDDEDYRVRAQVLPALIKYGKGEHVTAASRVLGDFLSSQDATVRATGIRIMGETGNRVVVLHLNDPSDTVRLAAATAFEELFMASDDAATMFPLAMRHMPTLLHDPVERIRVAAIRTLGQVGTPEILQHLLPVLTDTSPRVRKEVVEVLVRNGKTSLPLLQGVQKAEGNSQLNKIATSVLARIDRDAYVHDIFRYIRRNIRDIYEHFAQLAVLTPLKDFPSIGILQRTIIEYNDELTEEIFYLLSSIHAEEAVAVITESLDSDNPRARANAIEALETLVTPQLARLIAPLYDPEVSQKTLLQIGRDELEVEEKSLEAVIQDLLRDDNPWFRVTTAFALGEMGAELAQLQKPPTERLTQAPPPPVQAQIKEEAEPEEKAETRRRSRRLSSDALFGLLGGDEPEKAPEPAPPQPAPVPDDDEIHHTTTQILNPISPMVTAIPFNLDEIQVMLRFTGKGNLPEVQTAVRAARRIIESRNIITEVAGKEEAVLSAVEKIIFLKGVPFFEDMTVNQLKALATVTEEQFFPTDKTIFDEGDAGGILYVVVSGRVGIERKNRATGTSARLSTIEARGYFGEATLFDASPNFTTAIALQDTLTLRLRHEPLVALMQEYPDLSLQLIKVLSKRIQETDVQVADLSRRRSRTMHKLYDKLG